MNTIPQNIQHLLPKLSQPSRPSSSLLCVVYDCLCFAASESYQKSSLFIHQQNGLSTRYGTIVKRFLFTNLWPVVVQHQGKKHNVDLDPTSNGETFKFQLFSLTGVEPERQKILVKGGQLKDNTELASLGVKPGHVFKMLGTPSGAASTAIVKPKEPIKFLEDMTEAEAAQQEGAVPAGLQNLGNTCYMNATLQALRSIPELQDTLTTYKGQSTTEQASFSQLLGISDSSDLTASLRDLFSQMGQTQDSFAPLMFLNALRQAYPTFAQRSRDGHGYAQQDAEEAWSQVLTNLRPKLKLGGTDGNTEQFVDKYMAGTLVSTMTCDNPAAEAAGEKPVESKETFFKLNCHITSETNHLRDGIASGLSEKLEKRSAFLNEDASYTKTSTLTRLPKYLTVHFMRFDWRRDTNKKAKIMRKVSFPQELDVVEFCGEELKEILVPRRNKYRDARSLQVDAERAKKRQKRDKEDNPFEPKKDEKETKKDQDKKDQGKKKAGDGDVDMEDPESFKTDEEIEAERQAEILAVKKELLALVDEQETNDDSVNHVGLYELRGIITHQGVSADSGHYTAFIKKTAKGNDPLTGKPKKEDGKWWWFNDDKVTEFEGDRIETLSGGGESPLQISSLI
jgi:ubiquitin carboxyl-terminal hydrolase 14